MNWPFAVDHPARQQHESISMGYRRNFVEAVSLVILPSMQLVDFADSLVSVAGKALLEF